MSGGTNTSSTASGDKTMFGTCGIRLTSTPSTSSTIASGTSSRWATPRPTMTTRAIATPSVKSSCSPTCLPPGSVRVSGRCHAGCVSDELSFTPDLYRGTAGYYDRFRLSYAPALIGDLLGRTGPTGQGRLLDLACG